MSDAQKHWTKVKFVQKMVKKEPGAKKSKKKAEASKKVENESNKKVEVVEEVDPREAFRQVVLDAIKTAFELVTVNGEININVDNIFPLMKTLELNPNDEPIMDMVRTACIDTYGNISELEWDEKVVDQRKQTTGEEFEEDIKSAFSLIDKDADGVITTSDIYELMMGLGEMLTDEEITELIKTADLDNDGQINYRDFRIFLLGDTGEPIEEPVREEPKTEEKVEEVKEGEEGKEEEKKEDEEEKKEEVKKEEPKKPELSPEEQARRERRRKSMLMGYAQKIKAEEKKKEEMRKEEEKKEEERKRAEEKKKEEEDAKREEEQKKKEEEEEKKRQDSGFGSESDTDSSVDPNRPGSGVISVTVKHLESITENEEDEEVFESQSNSESAKRPTSSRPMSATPSVLSIPEDVTIIDDESEHEFGAFLDDLPSARTSSAKSRLQSGKSRLSSARSRLSSIHERTQGSSTDITDLNMSTEMDSMALSEDEEPIKDNRFTGSMSDRQIYYTQNFDSRHGYCEIGTDDDLENDVAVTQYSLFETAPLFVKYNNGFPIRQLQRCKSASKIQTIKKLEESILRRQNTDPKIDMNAIRQANEISRYSPIKTNANGLVCSHVNMKLLVTTEKENFSSYSRTLNRRPRTAPVLSTRTAPVLSTRTRQQNMKTPEVDENNNGLVNIVDLSRSLQTEDMGYPETPDLALKHSGYKSVWPLARVKSARNSKINNGKNIELNSFSRSLERVEIAPPRPKSAFEFATNQRHFYNGQSFRRKGQQSIINLELPYCQQSNIKKMSRLSKMAHNKPMRA
ncbi:myosin-M heavy chain-like isoform X2 [Ostrea edulis]|uniref:myosin-M heavy chain-like isoform X2 n=1 Tax=Ostrea edulis TaxID=37623 RepID=UPI0024AF6989|nr:myosin-M heavy chain-like isoform X2 [Ostrea edulis]